MRKNWKFGLLAVVALLMCSFMMKKEVVTIYMIGDSTMANKSLEKGNIERGWGMVLNEFLNDEIVVDNHAQNGRSTKSFIDEGRWDAVMNKLQPGDYVVIQFGHNDEKSDEARHTDPHTTFKANLERFVNEARSKGAKPILMNSIVRRAFKENKNNKLEDTHGEYIKVPKEVAKELKVAYVDANTVSKKIVEKLGDEESRKLFMWVEPNKYEFCPEGKQDNTHLNIEGAHVMAEALLEKMVKAVPELKQYVKDKN